MTIHSDKIDEEKREKIDTQEKTTAEKSTSDSLWGSDLYPERRGSKHKRSWFRMMLGVEGRESTDKIRCETNVYKCIKNSMLSLIYYLSVCKNKINIKINFLYFHIFINKISLLHSIFF